jgi:hypothetical protein
MSAGEIVEETLLLETTSRRGAVFRFLHVSWRPDGDHRVHDSLCIRVIRGPRSRDVSLPWGSMEALLEAVSVFKSRAARPRRVATDDEPRRTASDG